MNRGHGRLLLPRQVGQSERDLWPEFANRNSMHICLIMKGLTTAEVIILLYSEHTLQRQLQLELSG